MAPSFPDIDLVTGLIRDVASELVLPKFRTLRRDEILPKPTAGHDDDVVTVVDRSVERRLTEELRALVPAALVIGEEAAHAAPSALRHVESDGAVWIIDPLDGTHNFTAGHDGFGIMVSYAVDGRVRAAWIHLPVREECFVAEAGAGTFLNGLRVRVESAAPPDPLSGTFFVRYMPPHIRARVLDRVEGRFHDAPHAGAAAVEYTDVLRGRKDFVAYYRLLPWDHGAPALMLTEAGGHVEHLDGQPYTVRSANQLTVAARDTATIARLREWLDGAEE